VAMTMTPPWDWEVNKASWISLIKEGIRADATGRAI
jgi:hypothetical protein